MGYGDTPYGVGTYGGSEAGESGPAEVQATLTGSADLTAQAVAVMPVEGSLASSGDFSATLLLPVETSGDIVGSGAFAAMVSESYEVSGAAQGSGSYSASVSVVQVVEANGTLVGNGVLSASAIAVFEVEGTLVGTGIFGQDPPTKVTSTLKFPYTGDVQQWVVPADVTSIDLLLFGGEGGKVVPDTGTGDIYGGYGGCSRARHSVVPGETIWIRVGGAGQGVLGQGGGIGGGGGTDVRRIDESLNRRIQAAGGGGGQGYSPYKNGVEQSGNGGKATAGGRGGRARSNPVSSFSTGGNGSTDNGDFLMGLAGIPPQPGNTPEGGGGGGPLGGGQNASGPLGGDGAGRLSGQLNGGWPNGGHGGVVPLAGAGQNKLSGGGGGGHYGGGGSGLSQSPTSGSSGGGAGSNYISTGQAFGDGETPVPAGVALSFDPVLANHTGDGEAYLTYSSAITESALPLDLTGTGDFSATIVVPALIQGQLVGSGDFTAIALDPSTLEASLEGTGVFSAGASRVLGPGDTISYGSTGTLSLNSEQLSFTPEFRFQILDTRISRAPTSLTLAVDGGQADTEISIHIDGTLVWVTLLDSEGSLRPTSVDVSVAVGGTKGLHTVRIDQVTTSGTTITSSATYEILRDPPAHPINAGVDAQAVEVPGAVQHDTRHWVFQDLLPAEFGGIGSYILPINPSEMTSPHYETILQSRRTTAITGQFHITQAGNPPKEWEFSGYCPTEEMADALLAYRGLNRRFYVIDHHNRAWKVVFSNVDLVPRLRQNFNGVDTDWGSDYKVSAFILDQDWTNPA